MDERDFAPTPEPDDGFEYARSLLTGPARESHSAMEALWMIGSALRVLAAIDDDAVDNVHWRLRDALDLLAHGERRHAFQRVPRSPSVTLADFDGLL